MMLNKLSEARGVSGNEGEVRRVIREEAARYADEIHVDALGNLICHRRGADDLPKLMIAAHMDEVGLIITNINEKGLLRFLKVGGIDDRVLPSTVVRVGEEGIVGVIAAREGRTPKQREKVHSVEDMFIDIGACSEEEAAQKVRPGDYATFYTDFEDFGDGRLKGRAFDDRAGCAMLLEILRTESRVPLYAAFTVQEEVGLRGAQVAAWNIEPDMALVFEGTTCADVPESDSHVHSTTLGGGPALGMMDRTSIAHPAMIAQLVRVAEEENIPYQFRRSTAGGNDAGPIHLSRSGVPAATISTPCRYIHSPVSVLKRSDYENGVRLVKAFLQSIERGFRP
ncbi:MAG: M42 family metallopeptidase [Bacillota bacterium]